MTIVVILLSVIPSTLWARALTPVIVPEELSSNAVIQVPAFSRSSTVIWNNKFERRGFQNWKPVDNYEGAGLVTTCPVPNLHGILLSTISSVSMNDGSLRRHAKINSPDWNYNGRSYAVGSSRSLIAVESDTLANDYSYTEYGYAADAHCTFNESAAYSIQLLGSANGPTSIAVYMADGYLPNSFYGGIGDGVGESYSVVSSWNDFSHVLAW